MCDAVLEGHDNDGYNLYPRKSFMRLAMRRHMSITPSAMAHGEGRAWENEWAMYGAKIWQHIGMRRGDISSNLRSSILDHLSNSRIEVASDIINNTELLREVDSIRTRYTRK